MIAGKVRAVNPELKYVAWEGSAWVGSRFIADGPLDGKTESAGASRES